jgi:hypothetical protein
MIISITNYKQYILLKDVGGKNFTLPYFNPSILSGDFSFNFFIFSFSCSEISFAPLILSAVLVDGCRIAIIMGLLKEFHLKILKEKSIDSLNY